MARAKRHYVPGHVWHITHRCHKRGFLFKFAKDRRRWIEWLYRAKKRYRGLSVLDYMVTSNHTHLLVFDNAGRNIIPDSIKLAAGRTGQEYNMRKKRKGAFWQDRYHATAVENGRHLRQCIAYIDMNMVRAGVVDHPGKWECCGYNEIQNPRIRKGIIDFDRLRGLLGFETNEQLQQAHYKWVDSAIQADNKGREAKWTQSIAVGGESFVEIIKEKMGFRARGRKIRLTADSFELRETLEPYGATNALAFGNTFLWDK
jgi:putative transposase